MTNYSPDQKPNRVQIFDHLRAISIIFIIFYHYALEITHLQIRPKVSGIFENFNALQIYSGTTLASFTNILIAIFSIGWQFVGVFLFLSGFSLTHSRLTKNKQKSFIDNLSKFIPSWHIAIIFAFICNLIGDIFFRKYLVQAVSIAPSHYFFLLLFPLVIDFSFLHIPLINSSLWFVILIIQFYLAFEILFALLQKLGVYKFLLYSLLIAIIYRAVVIYFLHQQPSSVLGLPERGANLMAFLPARLFECSLGMVWAYLLYQGVDLLKILKTKLIILGVLSFLIGNIATWSINGWIFSDIMLTTGIIIISSALLNQLKNKQIKKYLLLVSQASFMLYLLHDQLITQVIVPQIFLLNQINKHSEYLFIVGALFILILITLFSLFYKRSSDFFKKRS